MNKTKLDMSNKHHRLLVGTLSMFIDDFGYSPRELFELMDNCKSPLWPAFQEMYQERTESK